ncbi:MAG: hypothetical protein ACMUIE_00770 [Thermoplasmatota archaeon]
MERKNPYFKFLPLNILFLSVFFLVFILTAFVGEWLMMIWFFGAGLFIDIWLFSQIPKMFEYNMEVFGDSVPTLRQVMENYFLKKRAREGSRK